MECAFVVLKYQQSAQANHIACREVFLVIDPHISALTIQSHLFGLLQIGVDKRRIAAIMNIVFGDHTVGHIVFARGE